VKLVVSPRATADLDRLRAYLAERSEPAALRATKVLLESLRLLGSFPGIGRPLGRSGLREHYVAFGKSVYVVRYYQSQKRNAVVILRIWHGRELRR
jgi:plasmid stabilization system protein ParE